MVNASALPPYAQLSKRIAAMIDTGEWEPGTQLPTVRRMAIDTGLASNTVARAYRSLEEAGYIRAEGRRGTFVRDRRVPVNGDPPEEPDPVCVCVSQEMMLRRPEPAWPENRLAGLLDDGFRLLDAEGRLHGPEAAVRIFTALAADPPRVSDIDSVRLTPGLILVTYVSQRSSARTRHSALWMRRVDGWRSRWHQETSISEPDQAPGPGPTDPPQPSRFPDLPA